MADHVLGVLSSMPGRLIVVTACPDARSLALAHGAEVIADVLQRGTSAAYEQALVTITPSHAKLLINPDLPLLDAADVQEMVRVPDSIAIAPDRRGIGTNALHLPAWTSFAPQFGPDSFARHRQSAILSGLSYRIVQRANIAADLDVPEDLLDLQRLTPEAVQTHE